MLQSCLINEGFAKILFKLRLHNNYRKELYMSDDDEDYEDNYYDDDEEDDNEENNTCLTCKHWGGNAHYTSGARLESLINQTGRCFCSGMNNPHYYNGDRLSSGDSCSFWEKHPLM